MVPSTNRPVQREGRSGVDIVTKTYHLVIFRYPVLSLVFGVEEECLDLPGGLRFNQLGVIIPILHKERGEKCPK